MGRVGALPRIHRRRDRHRPELVGGEHVLSARTAGPEHHVVRTCLCALPLGRLTLGPGACAPNNARSSTRSIRASLCL